MIIIPNPTSLKIRKLDFKYLNQLQEGSLTTEVLDEAPVYIDILNRNYKKWYNEASNKRDAIITEMQNQDPVAFEKLKNSEYNENLEEFVTNKNETERLIEYNGRIVQKIDPIFKDPENSFIKAHFYAPQKQLFGRFVSTFWVNIIVIWAMTILTYMVLYFRLLKRFLDYMGDASERRKNKKQK